MNDTASFAIEKDKPADHGWSAGSEPGRRSSCHEIAVVIFPVCRISTRGLEVWIGPVCVRADDRLGVIVERKAEEIVLRRIG